ncbi:MAG: XRE family transcriptional regulator [Magnetococcus sp. DMHC-1]
MTARQEAHINPEVIAWARKTSRLSIEEAARKIGRTSEDILAWENGEKLPTLAQARKAAEVYKRPLALFYFPKPPKDFSVLKDYRRVPEGESEEFTPELAYLIRQTQNRQEWMREFLMAARVQPLGFVGSTNTKEEPIKLASKIRQAVGVTSEEISQTRTVDEALLLWITKTESLGIYVFQAGSMLGQIIPPSVARGFLLTDEYAPFIFLNYQDAKAARIFTLAHELVHLWIGEPGVSNLENSGPPRNTKDRVEVYCNQVAAEILMPWDSFVIQWESMDPDAPQMERIALAANKFKVSREVVARRLLNMKKMNQEDYDKTIEQYRDEWKKERLNIKEKNKKNDESAPVYHPMKLNSNGKSFSRTVISAYKRGELSGRDTSKLLDMKLNHIPKQAKLLKLPIGNGRYQP